METRTPAPGSAKTPVSHSKVDGEGMFMNIDTITLAIILGCAAGAILLIVIAVILFRLRRGRRKLYDSTFNDLDPHRTRSVPTSRSNSPRPKRLSCPEVRTSGYPIPPMLRSATTDAIPFQLPPERVQPGWSGRRERGGSVSALPRQASILLGAVKPELYRAPSGSEDDDGCMTAAPYGRLWYSTVYDAAVEQLQVTLIKVKHLPGRPKNEGPRDPFVKMFLLPDEKVCKMSKVKKKTLSPMFNETFMFQVSPQEVHRRILRFSVYDVDKRRIRHSLGHVMIILKDIDLTKSDPMWSDLEPMAHATSSLGDLFFSLTYQPQAERIKLIINKVRNLRHIDYGGDTGMYVKIQYFHGRKTLKTKRTAQQLGAPDAEFNESFSFSITGRQLDSCSFLISVVTSHTERRTSHDEEYGRIVIGPFLFARGEELMHWQEMVSQPRTAVARWHTLSSTVCLEPDR